MAENLSLSAILQILASEILTFVAYVFVLGRLLDRSGSPPRRPRALAPVLRMYSRQTPRTYESGRKAA